MALFSRNKKEEKSAQPAGAEKTVVRTALPTDRNIASVIVKPRITEKAVGQSERNVYTFEVRVDATKRDVATAIKALYDVTPMKVNIVNKSPRQFMSRSKGRRLTEKGMKKAYVYLKKGDNITLA